VHGDINLSNPFYIVLLHNGSHEYKNMDTVDTVVLTYSWITFTHVRLFILYAFAVFRTPWDIQLPRSVQSLESVCLVSVLTVQDIRVLLKFLSNWQFWQHLTPQNYAVFSILHIIRNKFHEFWSQQLVFWTAWFLCIRVLATTYW